MRVIQKVCVALGRSTNRTISRLMGPSVTSQVNDAMGMWIAHREGLPALIKNFTPISHI